MVPDFHRVTLTLLPSSRPLCRSGIDTCSYGQRDWDTRGKNKPDTNLLWLDLCACAALTGFLISHGVFLFHRRAQSWTQEPCQEGRRC